MEEVKDYYIKVDLRAILPGISLEALNVLRDEVAEELRKRAREARKGQPSAKPEYRFWTGTITRRIGNALCRYRYHVEPFHLEDVPEELRGVIANTYFTHMPGSFKKATCPKVGDKVTLKYRACKSKSVSSNFRQSRIIGIAPKEVVDCKQEWHCIDIFSSSGRSMCLDCPDAILK